MPNGPTQTAPGPKPGRTLQHTGSGKTMTETELLSHGATQKDIDQMIADGGVADITPPQTPVGDTQKKSEVPSGERETSGILPGFFGPTTDSTATGASSGDEIPTTPTTTAPPTPAQTPPPTAPVKPAAAAKEAPGIFSSFTGFLKDVYGGVKDAVNKDLPFEAGIQEQKQTHPERLKALTAATIANMAADQKKYFRVDRPGPRANFPGQGDPFGTYTDKAPDSKFTFVNEKALDGLLQGMKGPDGKPVSDDMRQDVRNQIIQKIDSGREEYEAVQAAKRNYKLSTSEPEVQQTTTPIASHFGDSMNDYSYFKGLEDEQPRTARVPEPGHFVKASSGKSGFQEEIDYQQNLMHGTIPPPVAAPDGTFRNAMGNQTDAVTLAEENFKAAATGKEFETASVLSKGSLDEKAKDLQVQVDQGTLTVDAANQQIKDYQLSLQGSLTDFIKNKVRALNKKVGLPAVYQSEIDHLEQSLSHQSQQWAELPGKAPSTEDYAGSKPKEPTTEEYKATKDRLAYLKGLQASGDYVQEDDSNWNRAMAAGFKETMIAKNDYVKRQFNNMGMWGGVLSADAHLHGLRNFAGKQIQGFLNGIGSIEAMSGAVLNMMGAYGPGNYLTKRGTDYSAANELPAPIDEKGDQVVIDEDVPTWIARNVSAQIPLIAALGGTANISGAAAKSFLEGAGVFRNMSPFMEGAAGGLIEAVPESIMEKADSYNQYIAEGDTVAQAKAKSTKVFNENIVMTALFNPLEFGLMKMPINGKVGGLFHAGLEANINGGQEIVQNWIQERQTDPNLGLWQYATSPEGLSTGLSGAAVGIMQSTVMGKYQQWQVNKATKGLLSFDNQYNPEATSEDALPSNHVIARSVYNAIDMQDDYKRPAQLKKTVDKLEKAGTYSEEEADRVRAVIDDVASVKALVPKYGSKEQQMAVFSELMEIHTANKYYKNAGTENAGLDIQKKNVERDARIRRIMDGTEPLYFINGQETNKEQLTKVTDKLAATGALASDDLTISVSGDEETQKAIVQKIAATKKAVAAAKKAKKNGATIVTPAPAAAAPAAADPLAASTAPATEADVTPVTGTTTAPESKPAKATGFTTAKGSTYQVHEDGSTTRDKKARPDPGHEGDSGPQEKSEQTFYITKEQGDQLSIVQTEGWKEGEKPTIKHDEKSGQLAVVVEGGKNDGKPIKGTIIKPTTEPAVGLIPLELWSNGRAHHFGNPITEVNSEPAKETKPAPEKIVKPAPVNKPATDFETPDDEKTIFGKPESLFKKKVASINDDYVAKVERDGGEQEFDKFSDQMHGLLKHEFEKAGISADLATEEVRDRFMGELYDDSGASINENKTMREVMDDFVSGYKTKEATPGKKGTTTTTTAPETEVKPAPETKPAATTTPGLTKTDTERIKELLADPEPISYSASIGDKETTFQFGGITGGLSQKIVTTPAEQQRLKEHRTKRVAMTERYEAERKDNEAKEAEVPKLQAQYDLLTEKKRVKPEGVAMKERIKTLNKEIEAYKKRDREERNGNTEEFKNLQKQEDDILRDLLARASKEAETANEKKTEAAPETKTEPKTESKPETKTETEPVNEPDYDAISWQEFAKAVPYVGADHITSKDALDKKVASLKEAVADLEKEGNTVAAKEKQTALDQIKAFLHENTVRPLKKGDTIKALGKGPFTAEEIKVVDNIEFTLLKGKEGSGATRVFDIESGHVVVIKYYSDYAKAAAAHTEDLRRASAEPGQTTKGAIAPLTKLSGSVNKTQEAAFLERLNKAPHEFAGSEDKTVKKKDGAEFEFFTADGKDERFFVEGDYDQMATAVEDYLDKNEKNLQEVPPLKEDETTGDDFDYSTIQQKDGMSKADMWGDNKPPITAEQTGRAAPVVSLEEAKAIVLGWEEHALEIGKTGQNNKKVILSLFDRTGKATEPYHDAGYVTIHIDVQHTQTGELDYGALMEALASGERRLKVTGDLMSDFPNNILELKRALMDSGLTVEGLLSATPCTTFAVSGAQHWGKHDTEDFDEVDKRYGRWAAKHFVSPSEYNKGLVMLTEKWINELRPKFHAMENPVGRLKSEVNVPSEKMSFNPNLYGDPYTKKTLLWGQFNTALPTAHVEATEGSKMQAKYGSANKNERSATPHGFAYAFFMANGGGAVAKATTTKPAATITPESNTAKNAANARKMKGLQGNSYQDPDTKVVYKVIDFKEGNVILKDGKGNERSVEYEGPFLNFVDVTEEVKQQADGITSTSIQGRYNVKQYGDDTFTLEVAGDTYKVVLGTAGSFEDAVITKGGNPLTDKQRETKAGGGTFRLDYQLEQAVQTHVTEYSPESRQRLVAKYLAETKEPDAVIEATAALISALNIGRKGKGLYEESSIEPVGDYYVISASTDTDTVYNLLTADGKTPDGMPVNWRLQSLVMADLLELVKNKPTTQPKPTPTNETKTEVKTEVKTETETKVPAPVTPERAEQLRNLAEKKAAFKAAMNASRSTISFGADIAASIKALAAGVDLLASYTDIGMTKFRDIVMDLIKEYGSPFIDKHITQGLRKAYAAFRTELPRDQRKNYDSDDDLDDFIDNEMPGLLAMSADELDAATDQPYDGFQDDEPSETETETETTPVTAPVTAPVSTPKNTPKKPASTKSAAISATTIDDVSLKGLYDISGASPKDDHDSGNKAPERKFKLDLNNFSKNLAEKLGWEHKVLVKGKNPGRTAFSSVNVTPAGGDGSIEIFPVGQRIGVYINIPVERVYGGDNLQVRDTVMFRLVDRDDHSSPNQWIAKEDLTVGKMAEIISRQPGIISQGAEVETQIQTEPKNENDGTKTEQPGPGALTGQLGAATGEVPAAGGATDAPATTTVGATEQLPGQQGDRGNGDGNGSGTPGSTESVGEGTGVGTSYDASGGTGKNVDANEELGGQSKDTPQKQPGQGVLQPAHNGNNFVIPENFEHTATFNPSKKYEDNIKAMETLRDLLTSGLAATDAQKAELFKFVGFGGLKEILFDTRYPGDWSPSNEIYKEKVIRVQQLADELEDLGLESPMASIKGSVLNAHYTAIPVIRAIYKGLSLMGFNGGRIMEPSAGNGHFLGAMPQAMLAKSMLSAIEKDQITGHILKLLYPDAATFVGGLEMSNAQHNFYDLVISNIPFGNDINVFDQLFGNSKNTALIRSQKTIHNYFFAKGLEMARPGGLVAFISSTGVLDAKGNEFMRKHISETAEFLGAIRLPENAFKGNANTEVVTDIIFLRKFNKGEKSSQEHAFLETVPSELQHHEKGREAQTVAYNEFFHAHPEYMLGRPMAGGMYSASPGLTVIADKGADIEKQIAEAAQKLLGGKRYTQEVNKSSDQEAIKQHYIDAAKHTREGNLAITKDGKVGTIVPGRLGDQDRSLVTELGGKIPVKEVENFIKIRTALNDLFAQEISGAGDDVLIGKRESLNKAYDAFVKAHGTLHSIKNKKIISLDIDGFNVMALERVERTTGKILKSDIFSKRTLRPYVRQTSSDNIQDAMLVSLNETGFVSETRIAELLGKPFEQIAEENPGLLYELPDGGWAVASAYLSGNVREKLAAAEKAAAIDGRFQKNVDDLKKVLPSDLKPVDIEIRIGARWIDTKIYDQFAKQLFGYSGVTVGYLRASDSFRVNKGQGSPDERITYGTNRMGGADLLTEALHNRSPLIYDTDQDGKRVLNANATAKAIEKFNLIKERFNDWIWKDPTRREALARVYNDTFNTTISRAYDGSFLTFPGLNTLIELMPHQKDAIWMLIQNNGGIIDHVVGGGKTLIMVAGAMEMKRLGIANKTVITVLKSTLPQVRDTFATAYPLAKVLIVEDGDFSAKNRKAFLAQIANNDWDAIVMTHENYKAIPQDAGFQREIMGEELAALEIDIEALRKEKGALSKQQLKSLEKRKANLIAKMNRLASYQRDTELRNWQELGVDHMMVDESQQFKNLAYTTKSRGVAGLGKADGSQRSFNMLLGIRWLQKMHRGDKGATFLSGTPISNSIVEMDLLLKYLRPSKLAALGMPTFDSWASTFATHSAEPEFAVTGELKMKERFREFINLPELAMLYKEIADVRNDKNLVLAKPKFKGGSMMLADVEPSEAQQRFFANLIEFARTQDGTLLGIGPLSDGQQKAYMLLATGLAAKASIDMRMIFPEAADNPTGKLSVAADKIAAHFNESNEFKGTQLVFSDIGTPKSGKPSEDLRDLLQDEYKFSDEDMRLVFGEGEKLPAMGDIKKRLSEVLEYTDSEIADFIAESKVTQKFNVYAELRRKLIERGIPANEIAFIHDYDTPSKKTKLFDNALNDLVPPIRIVLGSTQKLGTGVNVQRRIVAMHHLDAPWKPSDIEQRNGRGLRQGNVVARDHFNNEMPVYAYATKQSLDTYKFQLLDVKENMLQSIKTNSTGLRTYKEGDGDEESGMSFAAFMSVLSGNPDILDKAKVDKQVQLLYTSKKNFDQSKFDAESQIRDRHNDIRSTENQNAALKTDMDTVAANSTPDPASTTGKPLFKVTLGEKTFEDAKEAGQYFMDHKIGKDQLKAGQKKLLGTVYGMDIVAEGVEFREGKVYHTGARYYVQGSTFTYKIETQYIDPLWQGRQLADTVVRGKNMYESGLEDIVKQKGLIAKYKELLDSKWGKDDQLAEAVAKQKVLTDRLNASAATNAATQTTPVVDDHDVDPDQDDQDQDDQDQDDQDDDQQVRGRQVPSGDPNAFYIGRDAKKKWTRLPLAQAEAITFPGTDIKFFVGKHPDGKWQVVEAGVGVRLTEANTRQEVISKSAALVKQHADALAGMVAKNKADIVKDDPNFYDEPFNKDDGYDASWEASDVDEEIARAKRDLKDDTEDQLAFGVGKAIMSLPALTKLAYLYIRKGVKTVAQFVAEIGERISQRMVQAWNAAKWRYKSRHGAVGPVMPAVSPGGSKGPKKGAAAPGAAPKMGSAFSKLSKKRQDAYNNALQMLKDYQRMIFGSEDITSDKTGLTKFNPLNTLNIAQDILFKTPIRAGSKALRGLTEKAMENQNKYFGYLTRNVGKALNAIVANLGKSAEEIMASERMAGAGRVKSITDAVKTDENLRKMIKDNPESLKRINQVVDPEFYSELTKDEWDNLFIKQFTQEVFDNTDPQEIQDTYDRYRARMGYDEPGYSLPTVNDLTPEEKLVYDHVRLIYDMMHEINFAIGKLTEETYEKNKGNYSARLYDHYEIPPETQEAFNATAGPLKMDETLYMEKGELTQWKLLNGISDPVYSASKRLAQTMSNKAIYDYADYILNHKEGAVSPTKAPRYDPRRKPGEQPKEKVPGYRFLGTGYGPLSRKWVRDDIAEDFIGHFYANAMLQDFYNFTKRYDKIWVRQMQKKFFTVYNPGVHVGNIMGNGMFATMIGVSMVRMAANVPWATRQMELYSADYRYLLEQNVLGTDIASTDLKAQQNKMPPPAAPGTTGPVTAGMTTEDAFELGKKIIGPNIVSTKITSFYRSVDDVSKIAAYKSLLQLGYTPKDAVNQVKQGFQNFKRVGKAYSLFSKIPLIGQPFGGFAGDLARILVTGMGTRPLQTMGAMYVLKYLSQLISRWQGEPDRDRKIREARAGAPVIPWPDILGGPIPLEFYAAGSVWNVARIFSPAYLYSSASGDDSFNFLQKLSFQPIEIPDDRSQRPGSEAVAKNINDPIFGPIFQLMFNADFRGMPILDPKETRYKDSELTDEEKTANAWRFLKRGYIPYYSVGSDFVSALQGKPDYYGRDRTPTQNIMSFLGVKVTDFPPTKYGKIMEQKMDSYGFRFQKEGDIMGSIIKKAGAGTITPKEFFARMAPHSVKKALIVQEAAAEWNRLTGLVGGYDLSKDDVIHQVNKRQVRKSGSTGEAEMGVIPEARPVEIPQVR